MSKRKQENGEVAAGSVQLSRGITAFRPSETDKKKFSAICSEATMKLHGRLVWVDNTPPAHRTYLIAVLKVSNSVVGVLNNREYVAFITVPDEDRPHAPKYEKCAPILHCVDMPAMADVFLTHEGFQVLSVSQLTQQPTSDKCGNLDAQELEDLRYWNPQNVGELIFNFWD